ncbi:O-antigen ligase family protein [Lactobacillus sp. ESL0701]|uniref:O-antigen ligase family protein n=1 Tax=Lactobacillus sp. ESL0701 TaxID=2983217 RepID=UPI0023F74B89|nr:O-antigen ligase family protein [Lactobacillus sp. ESL0701]MDF7672509.1 O-antigen ligase family protein [Lactobacillus sp. ESL0701]
MSENDNDSNANTLPWYKKTWGQRLIILVLIFMLGSNIFGTNMFLFLFGVITVIGSTGYFFYSLIKKRKLKTSIITFVIGFVLLSISSNMMPNNSSSDTQSTHSTKIHKQKKVPTKKTKKHSEIKKYRHVKKMSTHVVTNLTHRKRHKTSDNLSNNNQQITSDQDKQEKSNLEPQEGYVFVAPDHGKRYHFNPNCWGLKNADSIIKMTLAEAKSQGYTQCRINNDTP